ncbi:hypothetical protein C2845_PM04G25090 [Panicum miliaceum]|uniref:Fe2OG dioxygenase domain-containing protein n=1 Tax=Panicum miliaceum TaxID=4540 RepID=A0A3L6QUL2_PANMI|nr:hypothetical protein C2845_PM04G25090 [Panicum miliaceum]
MENLLHLAPSYTSLPDAFVIPPDRLTAATSAAVSLPVIDLSGSRDEVCRPIVDAGKEFGFFQVVNHGVSDLAIRDMESVCEEFFRLPAADKAHLYSEDSRRPNRLFSGSSYDTGGVKYWRDCLHLTCAFPVGDSTEGWPGKPPRFREFVEKFAAATRGAGMELLRLLCHGMGLRPGYFEGDISGGDLVLPVNHYPPCPDPSAALGLPPHRDRNLITLLLPGMVVPGLQIAYNGDWVDVEPVPNALVVNFGKQLEVVTNGALKREKNCVREGCKAASVQPCLDTRHVDEEASQSPSAGASAHARLRSAARLVRAQD